MKDSQVHNMYFTC